MSDRDMSGVEAADYAESETDGSGHGHGSEKSGSHFQSGLVDRFFDGSASGPEVGRVRADYDLDTSLALVLRGILRAAPGDGMPPIGEIFLGGLLAFKERSGSDGGGSDSSDGMEGIQVE